MKLLSLMTIPLTMIACSTSDVPPHDQAPVRVRVHEIVSEHVPTRHVYSGTIEGIRRVNLSTKIMGPIIDMTVTEGSRVSQGQLLVRIKSDDISAKRAQVKANLIEAQAALSNVETNYRRIKSLYENKTATQKEMDDVETGYRMAQARVKAVEEMEKEVADVAGFGDLVSPINGSVVKKMLEPGDMAVPGMPILIIEDISRVRAAIQVPESEIFLFHKGRRVTVKIDALDDVKWTGTVDEVNAGANPMSRQFDVKILLDKQQSQIQPGLFAEVIVEDESTQGVLVDESMIHRRGQLDGIYVVSPANEALLRWVKTGQRVDRRIEVLSGLAPGEQVIVESSTRLRDGLKVEVAR